MDKVCVLQEVKNYLKQFKQECKDSLGYDYAYYIGRLRACEFLIERIEFYQYNRLATINYLCGEMRNIERRAKNEVVRLWYSNPRNEYYWCLISLTRYVIMEVERYA